MKRLLFIFASLALTAGCVDRPRLTAPAFEVDVSTSTTSPGLVHVAIERNKLINDIPGPGESMA